MKDNSKPLPELSFLQECFLYNPRTGVLKWKIRPLRHFRTEGIWKASNSRLAGTIVGTSSPSGRTRISLSGEKYLSYRIIWFLFHGEDPIGYQIDHKDPDTSNNRIKNLRKATPGQNQYNKTAYSNNTSGYKNVYWLKREQKWAVAVRRNGKVVYGGTYESIEEAATVAKLLRRKYHKKFANE